MSIEEASSPKPTISELTEPAVQTSAQDDDSGDRRFIWLTQPPSIDYNNGNQPSAATNGTYSESLTRLQNGYLRAISALESRNEALQQELDNAREREKIHARLEQSSGGLQMKLDKTQEELAGRKMECTRLQATITRKNATIKERNMKIMQIEEENQRLRNELKVEKKNSTAGRTVKREGDVKPSASGVMDIHAYAAAMGWSNASTGAAARMAEPAQKKRKYTDTSCGGANNPYVIE